MTLNLLWLIMLVPVTIAGLLVCQRMKIPREPDKERIGDEEAVRAYDRVGRWPIFMLERRIMLHEMKKYCPRGVLVDIGCGPGYLVALVKQQFPRVDVIGLDIDGRVTRLAKGNPAFTPDTKLEFWTGDVQQLPIRENTIDFVVSSLSLHHWADAHASFREVHRVLKPGGQFIFLDLRRDSRRFFYLALRLGQAFMAPSALRRSNGAVGSFWASYTLSEIKNILCHGPFQEWHQKPQLGWVLIWGRKTL